MQGGFRWYLWQALGALLGLNTTRPKAQAGGLAYESAGTGRRTRGWNAPTVGPNAGVLGNLSTLRDRSRTAVRNDGYGSNAIEELVSNIVGSGIKPLSQAPDPIFRDRLQTLWLRWTDESDADGRLDFYGQQALAVRTWLEGGEGFARLRMRLPSDRMTVPLQVQLLEPELVPLTYNGVNGDNKIRAGIEFSPTGNREAYWMYRVRPGELQDMDVSKAVRIPASGVIHLYRPLRAGQLRGLPQLTQALVKLYELDQYDDATIVRAKIQNLFAAFVTQPAGAAGSSLVDPLTGQSVKTDENGLGILGLEPGLLQELLPGQEITFSNPPAAGGDTYPEFTRQRLQGVAAATRVPYEVLTGDMSHVNDRTVRVILNGFRRWLRQQINHIVVFQFCRGVWEPWFDRAVLSGALVVPLAYYDDPDVFRSYRAAEWVPERHQYIQPVQDIEADAAEVRAGFASRSQKVSERGDDVEALDKQIAEDNARADALGLKFDSDGRVPKGSAASQPAETPAPDAAPVQA